jgi:hypothetical protein
MTPAKLLWLNDMTPNPKGPRFILHDVPNDASENAVRLYDEYQTILELEKHVGWPGVKPENFVFKYSTYDRNSEPNIPALSTLQISSPCLEN